MDRCAECDGILWPWGKSKMRLRTHRKCYEDATTRDFVTNFERRIALKAKRLGAKDYAFVDWDSIAGSGEEKGANMHYYVEAKWPGALHDPDRSNNKTWAFLLIPEDIKDSVWKYD
jgi:hypothetical protein